MLLNHGVTCTLVNIALLRQKVLVPPCTFYSIPGTRSHIDASSLGDQDPERRNPSDARSHALSFDLTSYLKPIGHRASIRSFLQSSHWCMT